MRLFGCAKFRKLANAELDRVLTPREDAFLQRHRRVCGDCSEQHQQSSLALNFLRASAYDAVEVNPNFDERIIRRLRVQTRKESMAYWSPAVAGAFVAGLAVVASLQMITRSAELRHIRVPGAEVRRITPAKSFPELNQILYPDKKQR
jgi:hypothetical protein